MTQHRNSFLIAFVLFTALSQQCFSQDVRRDKALRKEFLKQAGEIEGAIWVFVLTPEPKTPKRNIQLRGGYRVADLKIFQAPKPGEGMTKEIGVSKPRFQSKETVVEFTSLRGRSGPGQWEKPLKGRALLKVTEFGKLQGMFIDSDGLRWKMRTVRIRE